MTAARTLTGADLAGLVRALLAAGTRVVAPRRATSSDPASVEYAEVSEPDQIVLDGPLPRRPLKEILFPPTEPLFRWRGAGKTFEIVETPDAFRATVVVGARPCDAAALAIVDRVMGWDYRDELWFGRREATTILALGCPEADDACFCTSVGLSPESRRGADWFLTPVAGGFAVEILTPAGEALAGRLTTPDAGLPAAAAPVAAGAGARVRANLDVAPGAIRVWLETHFDDPLWTRVALGCHGCGACAFVCPTCHCFDIVDEPEGLDSGTRRRNWDTCQAGVFTLHASGHNPRKDQAARFRQRVMHKFAIYPARFGEVLCTGCGRCVRVCAAGTDLVEILGDIDRAARAQGATA